MIFVAIIFFILAVLSVLLGALGITVVSIEAYKIFSVGFLVLGVLSYAVNLTIDRRHRMHH